MFIPATFCPVSMQEDRFLPLALRMAQAMAQGAMLEAASEPKPGLVCPSTSGVHKDMNIRTFMAGCSVIASAMTDFALCGMAHQGSPVSLFTELRSKGEIWETELMRATGGVNTHRGLLFAGGLAIAAAGRLRIDHKRICANDICSTVARMTTGLCSRELDAALSSRSPQTIGEGQYQRLGFTGIRGEVEVGLPSVLAGLPALREALGQGADVNTAMQHALLAIMAELNDSTVIHRAGIKNLHWLRQSAAEIFAMGGRLNSAGSKAYIAFCHECAARNVSPGGCADMLAVTAGIHLLERGSWEGSPF
jgi:triphosphoribosyl-dephospho-CoA synthetase